MTAARSSFDFFSACGESTPARRKSRPASRTFSASDGLRRLTASSANGQNTRHPAAFAAAIALSMSNFASPTPQPS